jgi:hypothetical protein
VNIQDKMATNKLNEDLNKFKSLIGYNPQKGIVTERVGPNRSNYLETKMLKEEDPEEGEEETTEEEPTDEEGGDFDFGEEGDPEEMGDEETTDEEGGEEETEDEFGTADEFSAVDDLESEEEVEEIDVTAIVKGSDEAKQMAQQAVTVGQENMTYLKSLTDKLSNLEAQLSKMDSIASKIGKLEQDIKTPEERLELRSLDSYPFNMKLTDYWEEKAMKDNNYRISSGESFEDGEQKEFVISPKDIEDYDKVDIKNSFMPESRSKKKVLSEGDKEQMDARTRIESILSQLDTEDRKVVEQDLAKNLSRGYVTKQQTLKNIKK